MFTPVIYRLALRYVSRRFLQSILFIFGVALGVSVIIAIDIANGSASRAFDLSTESVRGETTHQIIGSSTGLPSEIYRQVRDDLGINNSAPIIEEYLRGFSESVGIDNDQPLRLFGVDPIAEAPFRDYFSSVTADNDNPDNLGFDAITAFVSQPNAVLISDSLADRFDVTAGDSLTLRTGATQVEVFIVGLLQAGDGVSQQAIDDLVVTDIATAQDILNNPDHITRIDLIFTPEEAEIQLPLIEAILPQGSRVGAISEENSTLDQMTEAFELNLQALSLLALVVGIFLIYNTVTFSVVQRRPVIGILRSIGATKGQIFALILGEAWVLGIVGTILGVGMGIVFGRGAVNVVSQTISDIYFTVNVQRISIETITILKGVGIGIFASVITATIPSVDATNTPPAGTMRRSDQEGAIRRLLPYITLAGIGLGITGVLLLQLPTESLEVSFLSLFCIVVGGAFFSPIALVLITRLLTPINERLFGVVGRMASRAVVRSLSRTSIAVAALTVAVSVIVGVSVMISSFRSTVSDWLETTLGSDVYVSPPLLTANRSTVDVDPQLRDIISAVDGVEQVATVRNINVDAPAYPDLPLVNLQVVDFDIAVNRDFVWNNSPNDDYQTALMNGAVLVSEPFAFKRDIDEDNNMITLITNTGEQTFTVVGVYYDYSTDQGKVYMYRETYEQFWDDPYISSVGVFIEDGVDINTFIDTLRTDVLRDYDLIIRSNRDLRDEVFIVFDNAFSITVALQLLATLVAFIGILSALLALQLENTRQYGVMRATGMTPLQLWKFTLVQTGLMGTVAGIMAQPIGLALSVVLVYVINVRSFGWTMQFTPLPSEFITAFLVAFIAALIAGLYPAWRSTRLVIARALRAE